MPAEGFITFVKDSAVKSENPGANYLLAGFKRVGKTKVRNLTILQLFPEDIPEALAEVRLIHTLQMAKEHIKLAMDNGEMYDALDLYNDALKIEQELRRMKSEKARRKGQKWDSFEASQDPMDFLFSMYPEWLPTDMFELDEVQSALEIYFGELSPASSDRW